MTMRDPLISRAARRSRRPRVLAVAAAAIVIVGLIGLVPGSTPRAQEIPPAHSKPAPAPASITKPPLPPPVPTAGESAVTLPLTARLVTWPIWMAGTFTDEAWLPPILELSFGIRQRWFELSMEIGIAPNQMLDSPGTFFGLSVSVGFYSLRRDRVRLRHGLAFGLLSEVIFERHPPDMEFTPMPFARARLLDILVRVGKGLWLEISPLTASFPALYEASVGLRFDLAEPTKASPAPGRAPPADAKIRPFLSLDQGLVWWQHYQPPVVGSTFGRVGFRYRWFETAVGFGSPAWATWRARGFYELFVDLGFYSLRRARLRLRHQVRLGVLFHNPPFELHTWSGVVMHADFCIIALALGKGFWVELLPLTISIAPRDQLSSSVALRYEL
jgi:hypothetical protein